MILAYSLYADLIGKPFTVGARGPEAYDCLGLAIEIMQRRGMRLPAYVSESEELHRNLAGDAERLAGMQRVLQPQGGEVALFRSHASACHLGIMINPWHMVHTEQVVGCVVQRVAEWRKRLIGYYVAAGLAQ